MFSSRRFRWLFVFGLFAAASANAIPEGPEPNTPEWLQRELINFAKVGEAPLEEATNPAFMQRFFEQGLANNLEWMERGAADPSWLLLPSLNTLVTPLCGTWAMQCVGDPFRYPGFDGPDGKPFYEEEAEVIPVLYYDQGCARISGRVWAPRNGLNGLPAVVIENGSVQAPEPLYWWAAQLLVRAGYVVMTFDPRGQGRSDQQTPDGEQGSNFNPEVFWLGLVNAIDFFRSNSVHPYPHNETCAGTYPTEVTPFNPVVGRVDPERLGIAGHSLGARGVSIVQGYGAVGAEPWPGKLDSANPVKVAVAWDGISVDGGAGGAAGPLALLPEPIFAPLAGLVGGSGVATVPRVPIMGQNGEYGLTPAPFLQPPEPDSLKGGFTAWREAAIPVFEFTIQGSTHYEWSLLPTFPATSWCPSTEGGHCSGGWGNPMAQYYTLAWFDRWLKQPGESGYADADARLLADGDWRERYSFYFRSARSFPDRGGKAHLCDDIRVGCTDTEVAPGRGARGGSGVDLGDGGGGCSLAREPQRDASLLLVLLGVLALNLRRRLASNDGTEAA